MHATDYVDKSFIRKLLTRFKENEVTALAAQLAYFFLLSIFPLLIFVATLLPFLPISQNDILALINSYAPDDTAKLFETSITEIMGNRSGGLLSFGIIAAIWSASNGSNAIVRALNHAYDVKEDRNFLVQRGLALLLTLAMIFVLLLSLLLPIFGKQIGTIVFDYFGLLGTFESIWNIIRWVLSIVILFIVFTVLYWLGPNIKFKCRKAVPGALFASIGWSLSSLVFSFYVENFGNYSSTYGSLGATIVLMIWFYLTGIFIIIGGEINAIVAESQNKEC